MWGGRVVLVAPDHHLLLIADYLLLTYLEAMWGGRVVLVAPDHDGTHVNDFIQLEHDPHDAFLDLAR